MQRANIPGTTANPSQQVDVPISGEETAISNPPASGDRSVFVKRPVRFGLLQGQVRIAEDFDAPLPDDLLAAFEGR
ncbi:hypothetical protein [Burkholderia sp. MSMB1078WGS]|uniref:hypothetical protein n=1 Tax=Burkholderia sp. MSMB1078WGS TaxID=1637900 RepID=UPI0009E95C14|nr:hypothetical protein [Burkholderia sp. MSMB1078WGS]